MPKSRSPGPEEGGANIFTRRIDLDEDEDIVGGEYARLMREKSEREGRRLLGLDVKWQPLTTAEQETQLGSAERAASYRNIDTTTNPRVPKIREKQGIVAELIRQGLLPQELLRALPTVYLGSGTDVGYPIALGARRIELVDPIFVNPEAVRILEERLKLITKKEIKINIDGVTAIPFDFGSGPEILYITIVPRAYHQEGMRFDKSDKDYSFPDKVGAVILYASQGPDGHVRQGPDIEERIAKGGVILQERTLFKYPEGANGEVETILLGKDTD